MEMPTFRSGNRGAVYPDYALDVLGDRARSRRAAACMAFRVACSEHSMAVLARITPTRAWRSASRARSIRWPCSCRDASSCTASSIVCSEHSSAVVTRPRVSRARPVMCCAPVETRLRARPRASRARVSPHGPRGASGRSEGEARCVMPVARAATQQSSSRPSRLPMLEVYVDRVTKRAVAVVASARDPRAPRGL